nr:vegetative cell wall protein gp1-like [Aegilops tauschii subsp. strangulata]
MRCCYCLLKLLLPLEPPTRAHTRRRRWQLACAPPTRPRPLLLAHVPSLPPPPAVAQATRPAAAHRRLRPRTCPPPPLSAADASLALLLPHVRRDPARPCLAITRPQPPSHARPTPLLVRPRPRPRCPTMPLATHGRTPVTSCQPLLLPRASGNSRAGVPLRTLPSPSRAPPASSAHPGRALHRPWPCPSRAALAAGTPSGQRRPYPVVLAPDVHPAASDCARSTASTVFVDYVDASELGTHASRGSSCSLLCIATSCTWTPPPPEPPRRTASPSPSTHVVPVLLLDNRCHFPCNTGEDPGPPPPRALTSAFARATAAVPCPHAPADHYRPRSHPGPTSPSPVRCAADAPARAARARTRSPAPLATRVHAPDAASSPAARPRAKPVAATRCRSGHPPCCCTSPSPPPAPACLLLSAAPTPPSPYSCPMFVVTRRARASLSRACSLPLARAPHTPACAPTPAAATPDHAARDPWPRPRRLLPATAAAPRLRQQPRWRPAAAPLVSFARPLPPPPRTPGGSTPPLVVPLPRGTGRRHPIGSGCSPWPRVWVPLDPQARFDSGQLGLTC